MDSMNSENHQQYSQQCSNGPERVILSDSPNSQYASEPSQYHPQNPLSHSIPSFPLEQFPHQFAPTNFQFQRTYAINPMNPMNGQYSSQAQLNLGAGFSCQGLMSAPQIPFEHQTTNSSKGTRRKRKSKNSESVHVPTIRRNWTVDEDIALTKAWLHISVDAEVGTDQKSGTLWTRILQAWRGYMGVYDATRNTNSLGCRWGTIQASVNKFLGYYEQLERNPRSGSTPEDMKKEALRLYATFNEDQAFKFEHCLEIMKKNPKWCSQQLTKQSGSKKQKSIDNSSSDNPILPETTVGDVVLDMESELERPEGRKATKEKKKKVVADKGAVDVLGNMHSTWEKQYNLIKEELELKKERDQKEFELRKQTLKLELAFKERNQKLKEKAQRRKDQELIMNRKLADLEPHQRIKLEKIQANILEEWEKDAAVESVYMDV